MDNIDMIAEEKLPVATAPAGSAASGAAGTADKYPTRFKKGQSGNPNGRPKLTDEQKNALETIKSLAPKAAAVMKEILDSKTASLYAKIQVITLILNRTYGLPESSVKVTSTQQTMEASIACIQTLFQDLIPEGESDHE